MRIIHTISQLLKEALKSYYIIFILLPKIIYIYIYINPRLQNISHGDNRGDRGRKYSKTLDLDYPITEVTKEEFFEGNK